MEESAANNYFVNLFFDLDIHEYAYLAVTKGPNNYDPKTMSELLIEEIMY